MTISLLQSVHSRRREMAIFRACGANVRFVFVLLMSEACFLTFSAIALGWGLAAVLANAFEHYAMEVGGVGLSIQLLSTSSVVVVTAAAALGLLMGTAPAFIGYKSSLHDGLMRNT